MVRYGCEPAGLPHLMPAAYRRRVRGGAPTECSGSAQRTLFNRSPRAEQSLRLLVQSFGKPLCRPLSQPPRSACQLATKCAVGSCKELLVTCCSAGIGAEHVWNVDASLFQVLECAGKAQGCGVSTFIVTPISSVEVTTISSYSMFRPPSFTSLQHRGIVRSIRTIVCRRQFKQPCMAKDHENR